MSQHLANSGLYDEGLIDHRNARPLTIAFATIVTVWMLAFGIVSVSGQINAQSRNLANGCAAASSTMVRSEPEDSSNALAALATPRAHSRISARIETARPLRAAVAVFSLVPTRTGLLPRQIQKGVKP